MTDGKRPALWQQWIRAWGCDCAVVIILAGVCVFQRLGELHVNERNNREPFEGFRDDPERDLSRPFIEHETVPFSVLFSLVILVICIEVGIRAVEVYCRSGLHRSIQALIGASLCALECFFGSIAASQFFKDHFCRLRPDYIAREHIAATATIQTDTNTSFFAAEIVADGRISFPSGHATLMSAVFLLIILGRFRDIRFHSTIKHWIFTVIYSLILIVITTFVCITRVADNRHHVSDVIFGCIIGVITAVLCHLRWRSYTPLFSHMKQH